MSIKTYFHNGTAYGDADKAPYSSDLFTDIFSTIVNSTYSGVIPGYNSNLDIIPGTNRNVEVLSGAALVGGKLYINTPDYPLISETITLSPNNSSYPRIDRIVLRKDSSTQTVRLFVIEGTPTFFPSKSDPYNSCGNSLDFPIAAIYLPPAYATIDSYHIYDMREFVNNGYHTNFWSLDNLLADPNVNAFCPSGISVNSRRTQGLLIEGFKAMVAPVSSQRGGRGTPVNAGSFAYNGRVQTSDTETVPTTVAFKINNPFTTSDEYITFTWGSKSIRVYATNGVETFYIRDELTGYADFGFSYSAFSSYTTMYDYQATIGYIPAVDDVKTQRFVNMNGYLQLAGLSNGTTTIKSSDFLDFYAHYLSTEQIALKQFYSDSSPKALLLELWVRDSGSAASATPYAAIRPRGSSTDLIKNMVGSITNDTWQYKTGFFYPSIYEYNTKDAWSFDLFIEATGAATMDIEIYIVGAIL